jgi:hypothetical protein
VGRLEDRRPGQVGCVQNLAQHRRNMARDDAARAKAPARSKVGGVVPTGQRSSKAFISAHVQARQPCVGGGRYFRRWAGSLSIHSSSSAAPIILRMTMSQRRAASGRSDR